jgi:hypothetical protein
MESATFVKFGDHPPPTHRGRLGAELCTAVGAERWWGRPRPPPVPHFAGSRDRGGRDGRRGVTASPSTNPSASRARWKGRARRGRQGGAGRCSPAAPQIRGHRDRGGAGRGGRPRTRGGRAPNLTHAGGSGGEKPGARRPLRWLARPLLQREAGPALRAGPS